LRSGMPARRGAGTERGSRVKIRKAWFIVWPDGTRWFEDCPKLAFQPIMPGAKRVAVRVMGAGIQCEDCASGRH
jgi:hypothetical protein